jgi:site-specific DNA-methyltransferase (cytosine-N4-specific)
MDKQSSLLKSTRHSRIHPYPAMIADELAIELATRFADSTTRVLDLFCGTGRTLFAAAERGAECVGIDVNPLAILIGKAKVGANSPSWILEDLGNGRAQFNNKVLTDCTLEPMRKVRWFPKQARIELIQLIAWLNSLQVPRSFLNSLAVILSATVREVSFCRKDQWKLHRIPACRRRSYRPSAWDIFARRLRSYLDEQRDLKRLKGKVRFVLGDATTLTNDKHLKSLGQFDLVITSPPYGDSRTTVSYGGVSSLCLGVLQHVAGISIPFLSPSQIDRRCLGSKSDAANCTDGILTMYWHGSNDNPGRAKVVSFLNDLDVCCSQIEAVLRKRGRAIFIVSRRSVCGWRLYLDRFLHDRMLNRGFVLEWSKKRRLACKNTPSIVNSMGATRETVRTPTMREELVLSFVRP